MKRAVRRYGYITVDIYRLGLTTLAQTLTPLVLPLPVQQFIGEEAKGTVAAVRVPATGSIGRALCRATSP